MYTTTDITRCLGIKRERLKIWMTNGYIKPSQPGSGPGTKNLFSLYDLYILKLFSSLVERGFSREEAAKRTSLIRGSLHYDKGAHVDMIGFLRNTKQEEETGFPLIIYYEDAKDFANDSKDLMEEFFKFDCDDMILINFKKIREQVDGSLS